MNRASAPGFWLHDGRDRCKLMSAYRANIEDIGTMKLSTLIVFFMIAILVVSGSVTGQNVTDQIPACTDKEITLTAGVLSDQLAVFNDILVIIGEANDEKLPDLIADTEALQNQWWETDFEGIPQCGFSVQIASQYGHALDELLITLLFVEADMNAQANIHYATSTNLKNDIEAIVSDLPTAQAAPAQGVNVTAINQVNLRGGPGTNYRVAGTLSANQTAAAIARNTAGDWLVLDTGGWVATWVVTVTGDVNTLPVREAPPVPDSPPPAPSQPTQIPQSTLPPSQPTIPPAPTNPPAPGFTCDCSKTCGAMASCEEAYFQLNQCGCSARDGDGDGVPCESICPGG